jgi:hypothetical protein
LTWQSCSGPLARAKLAKSLRNLVNYEHTRKFGDPFKDLEPGIGDDSDFTHSLFSSLLGDALRNVDWEAVAQAVLMRANKWAPERGPGGRARPWNYAVGDVFPTWPAAAFELP